MDASIQIGSHRIVAMRYTMKNSAGEILANTLEEEPVRFLYGSGEILPGLEHPLTGLRIGEQKSFSLSPELFLNLDKPFISTSSSMI
ncbi:MAG: FKBP-type peptidyl-prolyl cis-trans isomerase [Cyclobacteriaceae bacterium]